MEDIDKIRLLYIDLFCGAGGTSTGVESAMTDGNKCAKVIVCVNHDANAIASHAANHPDALHCTEDIRTLELEPLILYVLRMKTKYPNALLVLWLSLECTNFSKAKGGQSRDADSRTLAEHTFRYIEAFDPDYIQIENVKEFMSWGKVDENGKPVTMDKGLSYLRWVKNVKKYGYDFDHRILNAADFGAFTSRERFFGQFAKDDLPITWPEPTHSKHSSGGLFAPQEKWKAVKEVLDLNDEGESIFNRKTPLVEKTLERIYAGLLKFVAGGKDKWLLKYNSVNGKTGVHIPPSIDEPAPVISCQGRMGLVSAQFLSKHYSGHPDSKNISIDGPADTLTTKDHHSLVSAGFLSAYYGNGDNVSDIDSPAPTVTTKDRLALVSSQFLSSYHYKDQAKDINNPCPTLVTKDKLALTTTKFIDQQFGQSKPASIENPVGALTANPKYNLVSCDKFIMNQYSGGGESSDIEKPCPAILATPKQNLISCKPWLMDTAFNNIGSSIEAPAPVITANRKWHYLMNPQFNSPGGDVEKPCFTLIARMDKMPPYLVTNDSGEGVIILYETDSPMTKKIKEFMAIYGIIDIKMRMLRIPELKKIMGFPDNYTLIGTQAEQKKYIGNAVEVNMARVLCASLAYKLIEFEKKANLSRILN